jgi:hypothetical protein
MRGEERETVGREKEGQEDLSHMIFYGREEKRSLYAKCSAPQAQTWGIGFFPISLSERNQTKSSRLLKGLIMQMAADGKAARFHFYCIVLYCIVFLIFSHDGRTI